MTKLANWWERYDLEGLVRPAYSHLEYLGHGANGVVFRAFSGRVDGPVALKFIRIRKTDSSARKRLRNEIEAMQRLNGNCAVRVYDSNVEAQPPFFAMEYLPLGDLTRRLKRPMGSLHLLSLCLEICKCIKVCHKEGIIHRDIKPENVLFRTYNEPVLSDFGICKIDKASLGTRVSEMMKRGTPLYMAPEQRRPGGKETERTDVFAFGTMLHFDFADRLRNIVIKEKVLTLDRTCTVSDQEKRASVERIIDTIRGSIERGKEYKNNRCFIIRIIKLIEGMNDRLNTDNVKLLALEAGYLRERLLEFNFVADKKGTYYTSKDWLNAGFLEEVPSYYRPHFLPPYDKYLNELHDHRKYENLPAEKIRQITRSEVSRFIQHAKRYLRERS